jgi:hypothetical protein
VPFLTDEPASLLPLLPQLKATAIKMIANDNINNLLTIFPPPFTGPYGSVIPAVFAGITLLLIIIC